MYVGRIGDRRCYANYNLSSNPRFGRWLIGAESVLRKRENTHRMAEANKAFANYRFCASDFGCRILGAVRIAKSWWIGIAFLCVLLFCAAPFFLGVVKIGDGPPWTDRVTEEQKTGLSRATGLNLPVGSRFLLYGEDDGRDLRVFYKLRLTDGELHTLLAQRPFQDAHWDREITFAGAAPIPGWNPGRSRKTRTTQVSIERKPGEATYLNIAIDPKEDGTDDVYLELSYS